jgi:hypothetical protein
MSDALDFMLSTAGEHPAPADDQFTVEVVIAFYSSIVNDVGARSPDLKILRKVWNCGRSFVPVTDVAALEPGIGKSPGSPSNG